MNRDNWERSLLHQPPPLAATESLGSNTTEMSATTSPTMKRNKASPPPFSGNVIPFNVAFKRIDDVEEEEEVTRRIPVSMVASFPPNFQPMALTAAPAKTILPLRCTKNSVQEEEDFSSMWDEEGNDQEVGVPSHHHHHPQQQPQPQQQNIAHVETSSTQVETTDGAVCFGWITHPATILWRSKVKLFSGNRSKYPTWKDHICDQVQELLLQDGVHCFLVCRGNDTNTRRRETIRTKNDDPTKWRVATPDEIFEKTMQRFKDDRKPPRPPPPPKAGKKRPRGRPRKMQRSEPTPEPTTTVEEVPCVASPNSVAIHLQQDPEMFQSGVMLQAWTLENSHTGESNRLTQIRQQWPSSSSLMSCPDQTKLLQVAWDQEETELPDLLNESICSGLDMVDQIGSEDFALFEPVPSSVRQPWYPIQPENVCFEWNQHHATDRWYQVVRDISANTDDYPEWNDSICDEITNQLAAENIHLFCSFLNAQYQPCSMISQGMWYRATKEEIVEKTKHQFWEYRRIPQDTTNTDTRHHDRPPTGGSNEPPTKDSKDNDDHWSAGGDFDDMDRQDSFGFFGGQDFGYQHGLGLAPPMDQVVELTTSHAACTVDKEPCVSRATVETSDCENEAHRDTSGIHQDTAGELLPKEEPVPDKLTCQPHESLALEGNPVEDDTSKSVGTDVNKVCFEIIEKPLCIVDAELIGSSATNVPFAHQHQTLTCGRVLLNQPQCDRPELGDITFVPDQPQEDSTKTDTTGWTSSDEKQDVVSNAEPSATASPLDKAPVSNQGSCERELQVPGAFRVLGLSRLQDDELSRLQDDEDVERPDDLTALHAIQNPGEVNFLGVNTLVVGFLGNDDQIVIPPDIEPLSYACSNIPDRLKPLCELMANGEPYTIISEKLAKGRWRRVLTSLDADEFGCLIANIKMDFDRPRVAELLAGRILDQNGAQGFTCGHAALAIKNTQFRGTMAERLLPYCVDLSSNLSLVKKELQDWDVSLLILSLCRKLQSSNVSSAGMGLDDPAPRRSIRHHLRASLKFIHKSIRRRAATTTR